MTGWTTAEPDVIDPEVLALAKDFVVDSGRFTLPVEAFKRWRRKHQALKGKGRRLRSRDLAALASRFSEHGPSSFDAVAQLCVLAADLLATK